MNDCVSHGHAWACKVASGGVTLKVCTKCGTDEVLEAVSTLRYFQSVCRGAQPIGRWPNEGVCKAIDVVLSRIGATP